MTWVDSSVSVISPRCNVGKLSQRVNVSLRVLAVLRHVLIWKLGA